MAITDDLQTKINTLINWPSSVPGWGAYFLEFLQSLDATQVALANVIISKAAGVHTHEGQGTLPILSRGVEADRLPDGVSLHLREDDVGRAEVIEDGAVAATLAHLPRATRHDHASYIALRPNGAGSWATLVTGQAGKLTLVLPYVAHTQADFTTRTGGLSQDGGTTYNVDFDVVSGLGVCALGALVVDAAGIVLAGRSGYSNDLAYWAEVLDAPQGVKRLSGVPASAAMLAVPASSSPATIHTATKRERVSIYAGRASGTTETQWLILQGNTSHGADTQIVTVAMEAKAPPALIWTGVLNAGEAIKICSASAGKFWVWGFAQEVEA